MDDIGESIVVLSVNSQGLRDKTKLHDVLTYLNKFHPHIICLQDTHLLSSDESEILKIWPGEVIINGKSTNSRGVAILLSKNFEYKIEHIFKDIDGNLIELDLIISDIKLKLFCIYGPNKDNPDFYESIENKIINNEQDYVLLAGDLNITLNPDLDSSNYVNINNPNARKKIIDILNKHDLIDIYRHFHPITRRYTWRRRNPIKQARLDYFVGSSTLSDLIQTTNIKPGYRTDHSIIELKILINKFQRGKGRWIFNNKLLENRDYIFEINKLIDEHKINYALPIYNPFNILNIPENDLQFTISDDTLLDLLIMKLRDYTIKFSIEQKKKVSNIEAKLLTDIAHLEINEHIPNINSKLIEKKLTLENLRNDRLSGHMIRSRAEWLHEGEKPTKYFMSLEKQNYINKTIKKIHDPTGKIYSKQEDILDQVKKYYLDLFSNHDQTLKTDQIDNFFADLDSPKLTNLQCKQLNEPISTTELSITLKNMKNNKVPGLDGFTAEFYKMFWLKIKILITRAIQIYFQKGELSPNLRRGIVTCLPKGNKPRELLKNWRPLSMLPVIYKLISSALSNRLKPLLPSLIPPTQTGFIDGRFMGDSTRLIYDLLKITEDKQIPGLLMLIDFEKAFDSLSWTFLYKTLSFFNFGQNFIHWIKTLNKNVTASVLQCGHFSNPFPIGRGCRQGDPIAPQLFILSAQILTLMINANENIKGIIIDGAEFKLTQFADDTTLILDGTIDSLRASLNILEIYGSISGLKINSEKTKLIWIGSRKNYKDKLTVDNNLNWGDTQFTLLGINFSTEIKDMEELNFSPILKIITSEIYRWHRRRLTPIGKIAVIKTLLLSKLNHLLLILPNLSPNFVKQIETLFYGFIWDNKPDKIKRVTLTQNYTNGGLKMIDFQNFLRGLKLTWIRRIVIHSDSQWNKLLALSIPNISNIFTLGTVFMNKIAKHTHNHFWSEIIQSYISFINKIKPKYKTDLLFTPIWFNDSINNGTLYIPNLARIGYNLISDFIDEACIPLTQQSILNQTNVHLNWLDHLKIVNGINNFLQYHSIDNQPLSVRPIIPLYLKPLLKNKKGSKDLYKIFKNDASTQIKAAPKWNQDLDLVLSEQNWNNIFNICFRTVPDNKLIWFQYRLIHRILGTRELQFKMGITENQKCGLCNLEDETLLHLFVNCNITKNFWNSINTWIFSKSGITIPLDPITKLFGYQLNNNFSTTLNTVILLIRKHLFNQSKFRSKPSLEMIKSSLVKTYNEQNVLSKLNYSDKTFNDNWNRFKNLIN